MMSIIKTRGISWIVIVSIMIMALPMWVLAEETGPTQNIEQLKQLREAQNQSTVLKNLRTNRVVTQANPDQERVRRLSRALDKATQQQPRFEKNAGLNLNPNAFSRHSSPEATLRDNPPSSIISGNGKITYASPDSMFFNFLTGENGSSSTGMDVEIGITMGMAFGNYGSFETDSSMVLLLERPGDIRLINSVPLIDDPTANWMSGSDSVAVGDIWVIYTGSSNLYAVLQVTGTSESFPDEHIQFAYKIQTDGSNNLYSLPVDIFYYSGTLSSTPGMEYFNFFNGTNSADSMGMDVRITGNEGTNFGDEGASWGDPSMLFYFDPSGSLDEVSMVPIVDDPTFTWTNISWDWQGGNNGQPLAIGNIWVIYTRTSNMYVALEVTAVEPWNQYFEFDYMIQTNGTNIFNGVMSNFDMTVNGQEADTLEVGSNPYFEINLDGSVYGELAVIWDGNHNGLLDDGDIGLEYYEFMDNDMHDENMTDGIFGVTYTDEMADGLNYLADDLLFVASSDMGMDITPVTFYSVATAYSVSGSIYMNDGGGAPLEGIVVWASYPRDDEGDGPSIIGVTDGAGQYHLDLPDSGLVIVGTEDYFGMTDGLVPAPNFLPVMVLGHEVGQNFYYVAPSSAIEGFVRDETGVPIEDVQVSAYSDDGPGHSAFTDETGYYSIGVMMGGYDVEIDWQTLSEAYLIPYGDYVDVGDFAVATVNFTLFTANDSITGNVSLDGMPMPGAYIFGQHHMLDAYSITMSGDGGYYSLPVHGDSTDFYSLGVHIEDMMEIVQTSDNWNVPAGRTGEVITLETLTGGVFGYFMNGETNTPILDGDEIGMMLRSIDTFDEYYSGPDYNGYYELHVPPGTYELMAGGREWMAMGVDTLIIGETLINFDIVLYPFVFDASLEGFVYDSQGMAVPYAQVHIGNDGWGTGTETDESGYYYLELPEGHYYFGAFAEGYQEWYGEIDIYQGANYHTFYLEPFLVDGAIYGQVYDSEHDFPIVGANIYLYGNEMGYMSMTDEDGEFWFDVPNGIYDLVVDTWDYPPHWENEIFVHNDTTYIDIALSQPDGGLEGIVRDDMGYPIMNAEVYIVSPMDSIAFWGWSNDSGYYSIPAMNGDYAVFARAEGFEPADFGMITIADTWLTMDITLLQRQYAVAPEINFIFDQPNDQGRFVRMQFWPGGTEWGPFSGYSIWRLTNTPMGPIMDFVEYLPNHDFDLYNVVLPTLVDSSAHVSNPEDYMSAFLVTGHWDMYRYIDGLPGLGYSVDNIHPGMPQLTLVNSSEDGVEIGWDTSMDDDFQYYEVYRATNPDFNDADVYLADEPAFFDEDVTVGQSYFYAVSAIDANGNASDPSNVVTTSIVSVDDLKVLPLTYGLSQNYPNPFNPTTSIEFALPEDSRVSLEIYNLLGQKVRTLVDGYVPAGYINTSWDGMDQNGKELSSGTYIYRLQTADQTFSKKMVYMK